MNKTKQKQKNYSVRYFALIFVIIIMTASMGLFFIAVGDGAIKEPSMVQTSNGDGIPNSEIISEMFDHYIDDYTQNGYFSSDYTPSLQGTYYSLSILEKIGKLDTINQSAITDFIMDHYNATSGLFMDDYALRYLDTDYNLEFYPLSSITEVNAYAVLSLEILGELDLIDSQAMIDFMWSCQHPSTGGFGGQAYDPDLFVYATAGTLDNTYFAVRVLNVLLDSWTGYTTQRDQFIDFITGSQELNPSSDHYGAFYIDPERKYPYLGYANPSLLSAYYALETLELFNMEDLIDTSAFHSYLDACYQPDADYFKIAHLTSFPNQSIYTATAVGLELSLLTGYTVVDDSEIINFLLSNRNDIGIWDVTDSYGFYELFDTFEIIRSLSNTGHINELDSAAKNAITSAMNVFRTYQGFSFYSQELTKASQLYSIAESFRMYDRVGDLEILEIYYDLEEAYWENIHQDTRVFWGYINTEGEYSRFKLSPIEFDSIGTRDHTDYIDYVSSHKWSYKALRALNKLYKLDDFDNYHNLTELLESAVDCQITDTESDKFGGFVPYDRVKLYMNPEKFVYFDHAYYAIKTLEFLTEWLGIGNISDTDIDTNALYVYLSPFIVETPNIIYCEPDHITGSNTELRLEHTYYLAELFDILEYPSLDTQKIKTFVQQSLDYGNIKNLYYCYKLNELLGLDIDFNLELTHQLIKDIYDPAEKKLYLTAEHQKTDPEIFYWICYMAQNDGYDLTLDYPATLEMDDEFSITATICNIILDTADTYHTVKLESNTLGNHELTKSTDETYIYSQTIPLNKTYFPQISGEICLYEGPILITSETFSFDTFYEWNYDLQIVNNSDLQEFTIHANLSSFTGLHPLEDGEATIDIYKDDIFQQSTYCSIDYVGTPTVYTKSITLSEYGEYRFDVYLYDGINTSKHFLQSYIYAYEDPSGSGDPDPDSPPDSNSTNSPPQIPPSIIMPIIIPSICIPLGVLGFVTYRKKFQTDTKSSLT